MIDLGYGAVAPMPADGAMPAGAPMPADGATPTDRPTPADGATAAGAAGAIFGAVVGKPLALGRIGIEAHDDNPLGDGAVNRGGNGLSLRAGDRDSINLGAR